MHDQSWPIDIPLLIHLSSFMSIEATLYVRHSYLCPMQCLNHLITVLFRYLKRSALYCNFILTLPAYVHKNDTNCILSPVSFSVPCINTDDVLYLQEWQDERLIWDPNEYNGLETLRMPCDKIWLPDIVLYNRYMLFLKSWLACLNNSLHIEIEIQRSNIAAIFQRGWLHFRIYAE